MALLRSGAMWPRLPVFRRSQAILCTAVAICLCLATPARGDDRPMAAPTLPWTVIQLLPSPGEAFHAGDRGLWLRWQVTPVLYAFSIRRGVSPWRFLVAEPSARVGGSLELHVSPEFLHLPGGSHWALAGGMRAWLPLYMRGDYLAGVIGAEDVYWRGSHHLGIEGGFSILFGILGVQTVWIPSAQGRPAWQFGLRLRYF
jgi:hypothetical protein